VTAGHRRRRWNDDGQVGGIEGLLFGVAVFALGSLFIANVWAVVDARFAAASAAREATRTFVESRGPLDRALLESEEVAERTISGYGRDPHKMSLVPEEAALRRCSRVTFRVEYPVPLVSIPLIGRYGRGFTASARHSEIVDPYRSGLRDRTSCPPSFEP